MLGRQQRTTTTKKYNSEDNRDNNPSTADSKNIEAELAHDMVCTHACILSPLLLLLLLLMLLLLSLLRRCPATGTSNVDMYFGCAGTVLLVLRACAERVWRCSRKRLYKNAFEACFICKLGGVGERAGTVLQPRLKLQSLTTEGEAAPLLISRLC